MVLLTIYTWMGYDVPNNRVLAGVILVGTLIITSFTKE